MIEFVVSPELDEWSFYVHIFFVTFIFYCGLIIIFQFPLWYRGFVSVLQLWSGKAVSARDLQKFRQRLHCRCEKWATVWSREVLGVHETVSSFGTNFHGAYSDTTFRCKIAKQLVVDPFLQKELAKYKTPDDFYIVSFCRTSYSSE